MASGFGVGFSRPKIGEEAAAGEEVFGAATRAAIFDARRQHAAAAAVHANRSAGLKRTAARLDVDDAGVAESILSGKCAGDERQAADEAGVEDLAKARNTVRDDDAINPVLQVAVLIAYMQVATGGRVERDAWRLQEDLVQRRVRALGSRLDVLVAQAIGIHADLG